jgi:hypothetical protein
VLVRAELALVSVQPHRRSGRLWTVVTAGALDVVAVVVVVTVARGFELGLSPSIGEELDEEEELFVGRKGRVRSANQLWEDDT